MAGKGKDKTISPQDKNIQDHLKKLDESILYTKDPYKGFREVYGRNGVFPEESPLKKEFDGIQVPASKELDDNMVAAIIFGSALNHNPSNPEMKGESGVQAKREAADAIREFNEGHPEKVNAYMQKFIDYAAEAAKTDVHYDSGMFLSEENRNSTKQMIRLAGEILQKEPFNKSIKISDYDRLKLNASYNQSKARDKVFELKSRLMKNPPQRNTKERGDAVAELMFYEYVSGALKAGAASDRAKGDMLLSQLYDQYGVAPGSPEHAAVNAGVRESTNVRLSMESNIRRNLTNDTEGLLAQPDGLNSFRTLYMKDIRNSETYKKLLDAKDTSFQDQLLMLEDTTSKGFSSLKPIQIFAGTRRFNKAQAGALEEGIRKTEQLLQDILNRHAQQNNRIEEYSKAELGKNLARIKAYEEEFGDKAGAVEEEGLGLDYISTDFKELRLAANSMAENGNVSAGDLKKYSGIIDRLRKKINSYLDENKGTINAQKKPLILFLRNLSRNLEWNKREVLRPGKEMGLEVPGEAEIPKKDEIIEEKPIKEIKEIKEKPGNEINEEKIAAEKTAKEKQPEEKKRRHEIHGMPEKSEWSESGDEDSLSEIIPTGQIRRAAKNRSSDPEAQTKADAFVKNAKNFNYVRAKILDALCKATDKFKNKELNRNEEIILRSLLYCRYVFAGNSVTPRRMLNALADLKAASGVKWHPLHERANRWIFVLSEAMRPLADTGDVYAPFSSKNLLDETVGNISNAEQVAAEDYDVHSADTRQQRDEIFRETCDKAQARKALHETLQLVSRKTIFPQVGNWDAESAVVEDDREDSLHDKAKVCVLKYFLERSEAPDADKEVIRGLAWSAANHGYEGQVKELERNPVFKEVVRKYPENCYTHWKHVMKRADEEKVKAASKLEQMKKAGDLSGLIGYVINGNNNLSLIHQNRPEDIMVRNARLAKVIGFQMLQDPMFQTLRQAVAQKMISTAEVILEALDYVEKKKIRVLNDNGEIDRDFSRKLENGTFCKDILRSKNKILKQIRSRGNAEKVRLMNKLRTNTPENAGRSRQI